jgi:DNA-binding CsgD family transcriptional regulator
MVFPDVPLTSREREVLDRVLRAQTRRAIAQDLGVKPRTVETHMTSILKKTGTHSVVALCRKAWHIDEREKSEEVPSSTLTDGPIQR